LFASTVAIANPQSDDFNRFNLNQQIWTVVNPDGDSAVRLAGAGTGQASLELEVHAGVSHDPWMTNNALRVMQQISDVDFSIEARFLSEPTKRYQMQGLLVEQDSGNWIRFDVYHDGATLHVFAATTVNGVSSVWFNRAIDAGDAGGLRLARTADTWTFLYLDASTGWRSAGPSKTRALNVSAAGLFAANHPAGSAPAFTAVIDSFENAAAPIVAEDEGTPGDTIPPFIHSFHTAVVGPDAFEATWFTDEPALGAVDLGLTNTYEIGTVTDQGGLYAHAITITGVTPGLTHHYQARSTDVNGNTASTQDFTILLAAGDGPQIDVWYGLDQSFGGIGQPQPWVNILGNAHDPNGDLATLSYTLNNASVSTPLSIGPDGKRLDRPGDFNVDIATTELLPGANTVQITATDAIGAVANTTVMVNYTPDTIWPLPALVDWSVAVDPVNLNTVSQVVDGDWILEQRAGMAMVRTGITGYDRLIAVGDQSWSDYEFEFPFVLNSQSPCSGTGVVAGWKGHTDNPLSNWQPKTGFLPLGAQLWVRPNIFELRDNRARVLATASRSLPLNTLLMFKGRTEPIPGQGVQLSLKVWTLGQPEPASWDLVAIDSTIASLNGSLLLVSHFDDTSFGPITVSRNVSAADTTPPALLNIVATATDLTAQITWTTDEPADSLVEYGLTALYGAQVSDPSLSTNHVATLVNLTPDTTYHFHVISTDASGNYIESADMQFNTSAVTPPPPSVLQSDEFNSSTLDTSVWTFRAAPDNEGVLNMTGAQASISVAGPVAHELWTPGIQAPRLMQPIADADFFIEIKIDSTVSQRYQEQGFMVQQDTNNFLRFEFYSDGARMNVFAAALHSSSPTIAINKAVQLTAPFYMRVERRGTKWTQTYSDDGVNWLTGGVFQNESLVPAAVGLYSGNALNGNAPNHTAVFDYFRSLPLTTIAFQQPCPADFNADRTVSSKDLALLLQSLGMVGDPTDLDQSGTTNSADVAAAMRAWGDCP